MANGPVPTYAEFIAACVKPEAFSDIAQATVEGTLARKVDVVVSALGDRAEPPIVDWDGACIDCVFALTSRALMGNRGYNRQAGADAEIAAMATVADEWLARVRSKEEHPVFTDSHSGNVADAPILSRSERADDWTRTNRWW